MVTLQPGNVPGISVDADPNDLSSSKYTFPDWFNQDFWPAIAPGLSTWYPNYAAMTAAVPSGPGLNWIAGTSAEQTIWATINGSAWFAVGSFARSTTFAPKWYSWDGTTELNTATNGGPATDLSGSYIRNGKLEARPGVQCWYGPVASVAAHRRNRICQRRGGETHPHLQRWCPNRPTADGHQDWPEPYQLPETGRHLVGIQLGFVDHHGGGHRPDHRANPVRGIPVRGRMPQLSRCRRWI